MSCFGALKYDFDCNVDAKNSTSQPNWSNFESLWRKFILTVTWRNWAKLNNFFGLERESVPKAEVSFPAQCRYTGSISKTSRGNVCEKTGFAIVTRSKVKINEAVLKKLMFACTLTLFNEPNLSLGKNERFSWWTDKGISGINSVATAYSVYAKAAVQAEFTAHHFWACIATWRMTRWVIVAFLRKKCPIR